MPVNQNQYLFGPGPLRRAGAGVATGPPLQGLVKVAIQGLGLGAIAAITYKVSFHDPTKRDIDEFYAKHNNS